MSMRLARLGMAVACALVLSVAAGPAGPAEAAGAVEPNGAGFVLWDGADPDNITPGGIGSGAYRVVFPGQAATGGVVHVTAIAGGPSWCQVRGFGPLGADEVVDLRCFRAHVGPSDSYFSITFHARGQTAQPGPGRYGYIDAWPDGRIVSQYNSARQVNAVAQVGTGRWTVRLPGLGTPVAAAGGVQVTAINPSVPAHCKVGDWTSSAANQVVTVVCHDITGAPVDTRFALTFQYEQALQGGAYPPNQFGYVRYPAPDNPLATNFNSVSGPGGNTVSVSPAGVPSVTYPALTTRPSTVQVSAYGRADLCNLAEPWRVSRGSTIVPGIRCYTADGAPVTPAFLASYDSAS